MAKSDAGGTIITALVVIAGGYVGLVLFSKLTAANAASNAQNQNFFSKLVNSLKGSGSGGGGKSGGSGGGSNPGAAAGLSNSAGFSLGSLIQSLQDGEGVLNQYNPLTNGDASLPLIGSDPVQSFFDATGFNGFDSSSFSSGLSPNNDTSGAGLIPDNSIAGIDLGSGPDLSGDFGGGGGGGGVDFTDSPNLD